MAPYHADRLQEPEYERILGRSLPQARSVRSHVSIVSTSSETSFTARQ